MEKKGWLAAAEKGQKKEYALTPAGREAVRRELARLQAVEELARAILKEEEP